MPSPSAAPVAKIIRLAAKERTLTDAKLLERFNSTRDKPIFSFLLRRSTRIAFEVCHHFLRFSQDKEDAFQTTFLAPANRKFSIFHKERLNNWLSGVASRVSLRAPAMEEKHQNKVQIAAEHLALSVYRASATCEGQDVIDVELQRHFRRCVEFSRNDNSNGTASAIADPAYSNLVAEVESTGHHANRAKTVTAVTDGRIEVPVECLDRDLIVHKYSLPTTAIEEISYAPHLGPETH